MIKRDIKKEHVCNDPVFKNINNMYLRQEELNTELLKVVLESLVGKLSIMFILLGGWVGGGAAD